MQKRDRFGRFLKKKISKKNTVKKAKSNGFKKVTVSKVHPKVNELSIFDLHEMIAAEVACQLWANR